MYDIDGVNIDNFQTYENVNWMYDVFKFQFNMNNVNYSKKTKNAIVEILKKIYVKNIIVSKIENHIVGFFVYQQYDIIRLLNLMENNLIKKDEFYNLFEAKFMVQYLKKQEA